MRTQSAPRQWVGTCEAFDQPLVVNAEIRRDIIEKSEGGKLVWLPGEYYMLGKLRVTPSKLIPYAGVGNLLVDFGEFKLKMRLKDTEGNVESISGDVDGKPPEELWLRSGGGPV